MNERRASGRTPNPQSAQRIGKDFIVSMNFNFDFYEVGYPTHGRSTMETRIWNLASLVLGIVSLCAAPFAAHAFDSGSTGVNGAFVPTVNTERQLPPDGVFNFTNVNIPAGVTVTFAKNATNTPVTILASGDVTIAADAALGERVIRLDSPAGATTDVSAAANTFTVEP
jgi:hypothetical protein